MNGDHSLAVHALVYLDHRATHLPSQILAENICTNAARVRKVMRPLASAGLIATKEGAEGGYALARPAAEITLRGSESHRHHFCESELDTGRRTRGLSGVIFNGRSDERHLCRSQPHLPRTTRTHHHPRHHRTDIQRAQRLIIPRVSPSQHQSITLRQSKKKTDAARHTTHQHNALLSLEYVRK